MKFDLLKQFAYEHNTELTEEQINSCEKFAEMLVEANTRMNLTGITDPRQIEIKHMIDSMAAVPVIRNMYKVGFTLLDVGCGAGFPGLPLKIAFPEDHFVLLDSLNKRINFVNSVINELKLSNIETACIRAEDFDKKEYFDICVSRAVAEMNILLEYSMPFVKVNGCCILYKSGDIDSEIQNSKKALKEFGGTIEDVIRFDLPEGFGERSLIIVKKISKTPEKYPRRAGKPSKSPIR